MKKKTKSKKEGGVMKNKKNIGIEDKIVFFSNTLGSFVLSACLINSKSFIESLLGIYCLFNMFCYFIIVKKLYGGEK